MSQPDDLKQTPAIVESKGFYPSPLMANIFAFVCACLVENTSSPISRNLDAFLGGLIVQLLLIVPLSNIVAYFASSKGKNRQKFGWVFVVCTAILTGIAYAAASQS